MESSRSPQKDKVREIAEAALSEIERLSGLDSIMVSSTSLGLLAQGYLDILKEKDG